MNLESLRAVQVDERGSTDLQPLPDSFYRDVAEYLDGLRAEREQAAARSNDPFGSEEVRRLTDEIETAEEVVEAIYERRVGKVVNRASLAAAGMSADDDGLTAEEAELFADLVALIETHREDTLDDIATGTQLTAPRESDADHSDTIDREDPEVTSTSTADHSASEPGSGDPSGSIDTGIETTDEPSSDTGEDGSEDRGQSPVLTEDQSRVTVRITQDVGEIYGVDERTYDLTAEDVVTLPKANADPLVERDAAERLE